MRRALALAALTGCFGYPALPNDRPDPVIRKLADAKIVDMQINLHKQTGLCPGHTGKLYVNGTVQWPGMKPVLRSLGNDVDSFDPANFAISGPLLHGDARANLYPDGDVLKSISDGFAIDVVYKPQPRFRFHEVFPPEYSCFTGSAVPGDAGAAGNGGEGGQSGSEGENGERGGDGGPGGPGGSGGRLEAYVTVVATKFYPKLYAVIANGTFYLAPPDRQLVFAAPGGPGGQGGAGGPGGNGGDQATHEVEHRDDDGNTESVTVGQGPAGNGGQGGHGGDGGRGGDGGLVVVTYDAAYPELRQYVAVDVRGGAGGAPGPAGAGGSAGGSTAQQDAQQGQAGSDGEPGREGRSGREGRAMIRPGAVAGMFRSIPGIQLGGAAPARVPHRRHR